MLKIINLTPHDIHLPEQGITFPKTLVDRKVLQVRAQQSDEKAFEVQGIPVVKTTFGSPYLCTTNERGQEEEEFIGTIPGLNQEDEVLFIVSRLALTAIQEKGGLDFWDKDMFLSPGKAVRNEQGQIIGSEGLSI